MNKRRDFITSVRIAMTDMRSSGMVTIARAEANPPPDTELQLDIWLTPQTVADFRAKDFIDLPPTALSRLAAEVQQFAQLATRAPASGPVQDRDLREQAAQSLSAIWQALEQSS